MGLTTASGSGSGALWHAKMATTKPRVMTRRDMMSSCGGHCSLAAHDLISIHS